MIYSFSQSSLSRLAECHPDLRRIAHELIKEMNVTVVCGHRDEAQQNLAFAKGMSKLQWPDSKHNKTPSEAMDICPYPISWGDIQGFLDMCTMIELIAQNLGIKIRLGRDFTFRDLDHVELVLTDT